MIEAPLPVMGPSARSFRLAVIDDLQVVQALTGAAYAPYTVLLGYPPLPATEDHRPRVEAGQVHLAEVAGTVVGLLVLERHPEHAMIYSVAVLPNRQGEGHGLALLRLAEEEARSWGVPELRLYTNARMERNIGLYAAMASTRPDDVRIRGDRASPSWT